MRNGPDPEPTSEPADQSNGTEGDYGENNAGCEGDPE
jgi:hypothetical protein